MSRRIAALLVALSASPSLVNAKPSDDIFVCSRGSFHFSFTAPYLDVGKVIILTMWQHKEEPRGALGIIRELSENGDLVADFPVGSDLRVDPAKTTTTVKYIASLKEGILTVAPGNVAVGQVVSGKCKVNKTSNK